MTKKPAVVGSGVGTAGNVSLLGKSAPSAGAPAAVTSGFVIDLGGVEGSLKSDFPIKPEGLYTVEITDIKFAPSKAGSPMVTFEFGFMGDDKGKIWDYCVLGGKGQEFGVKRLVKYLNILMPGMVLATFDPAEFAADLTQVGKVLDITIKHQKQTKGDNKGQMRETIIDANIAGQGINTSGAGMSNSLL